MALVMTLLGCLLPQLGFAEGIPALKVLEGNDGGTEYSLSLQLIIVMTLLSLLPSILILMTSFTRIIIVLSLLRQAMGTAQTPPNQVLIGIALFLTLFTIGFLIYIPFIIIDLVVASVLMSMGMMMLSPMMISMPFKLLLFVLVDGWGLVNGSLVATYMT